MGEASMPAKVSARGFAQHPFGTSFCNVWLDFGTRLGWILVYLLRYFSDTLLRQGIIPIRRMLHDVDGTDDDGTTKGRTGRGRTTMTKRTTKWKGQRTDDDDGTGEGTDGQRTNYDGDGGTDTTGRTRRDGRTENERRRRRKFK